MEWTRRILNFIFWVAVTIGSIWLLIMFLGGGFPFTLSTTDADIRFDVSKMGWQSLLSDNGLMTITREKNMAKVGWGCLQFDYKFNRKRPPGFYTTNYGFESLISLKFWMKARNPCTVGVRLKDKQEEYEFLVPLQVGTKWHQYILSAQHFRDAANYRGKLDANRFGGYIEFRDMTARPPSKTNTLWIDQIEIRR
ncbi:MAG: hypothetical protein RDV48_01845 [Candidatus Eremiobacteraeota bacterium]|nr:hypothetical protein [Candidatus Eremiobacteraeota bacterium]